MIKKQRNKSSIKAKAVISSDFDKKHPRDVDGRFIEKKA